MTGEYIKKAREIRGVTEQQIADYLNIKLRTYRAYESGERQPSIEIIIEIADYLYATVDYLLGVTRQ